MAIDSEDPNDPSNYDEEGSTPSPKSEPVSEKDKQSIPDLHPCLTVLQRYLSRYPLIERWTILEDVIDHSLEFRITLVKKDPKSPGPEPSSSRRYGTKEG